jgi:catechol 2,3-dioxygenase-like lactoylglutathione lyase family enzyme
MNTHVSSILLGVQDMDRSKEFDTEGLGWKVYRDYGISVFFEPHGGSLVGFYGRDGLAANVGASPEGSGFSGLVLTYVVRSEARVDEILAEAEKGAPRSSSPPPPWSGEGTVARSRTPTARAGTSATAPRERTSPTRSSRRGGPHGELGLGGVAHGRVGTGGTDDRKEDHEELH